MSSPRCACVGAHGAARSRRQGLCSVGTSPVPALPPPSWPPSRFPAVSRPQVVLPPTRAHACRMRGSPRHIPWRDTAPLPQGSASPQTLLILLPPAAEWLRHRALPAMPPGEMAAVPPEGLVSDWEGEARLLHRARQPRTQHRSGKSPEMPAFAVSVRERWSRLRGFVLYAH